MQFYSYDVHYGVGIPFIISLLKMYMWKKKIIDYAFKCVTGYPVFYM